jgi:iron complex outermembrane receptor protein
MMACAIGALTAAASVAHADTAAATVDATATSATSTVNSAMVADIVVTAEKREATVQTVPLAISAYTSKERDLIGLNNIDDLTNWTPGLRYSTSLDRVFLRGVGRQTNNLATDPGVATYVDGVYDAATYDSEGDSLFIQRTEVLRGPQGTLYGRNSIGGAIDVISVQPTDHFYAEGRVNIGNYGTYDGEAAMSGPINDHMRIRVAGYYNDQQDGFFHNVAIPGTSEDGNQQAWYGEVQLAGDFGPKFDYWIKANAAASDATYRTTNNILGYNTYQYVAQGTLGLNPGFAYNPCFTASQATPCAASPTGFGLNGTFQQAGTVMTNPAVTDQFAYNLAKPDKIDIRPNYGFNWHGTFHADGFDVKYLGGWAHHYLTIDDPNSGGTPVTGLTIPCLPPPFASASCQSFQLFPTDWHYLEDKSWTSHEVDLISTTKGPFQWLVGGYYYHEWYTQYSNYTSPSQTQLTQPLGAAANPDNTYYFTGETFEASSYAGFGQIDWQLTPTWKVTGGLRYSEDTKDGHEFFREVFLEGLPTTGAATPSFDLTPKTLAFANPPGAGPLVLGQTVLGEPGMDTRALDGSWSGISGTAGVEWDPTSDLIAYAKYSRGYKAGGFNGGTLSVSPEVVPETLDDIEGGVKKTFNHVLTLDASVYYYWYHNMQVEQFQLENGVETGFLGNLNLVNNYGFELEGSWQATPNLNFLLSYAYLNTRIAQATCIFDQTRAVSASDAVCTAAGSAAVGFFSPVGDNLIASPPNKISVNGNYTWKFDPGNLTFSVSDTYTDGQYSTLFSTPIYHSPGYNNLDLRMLWTDAKNRYTIIAYGKNVLNSTEYDYNFPGSLYSSGPLTGQLTSITHSLNNPVTYGVQLQVRWQ